MKTVHVLRLFLRHWIAIGLITLAVGVGVFAFSATRTPQYTATSSLYFTVAAGATPVGLSQGSTYLQDQMDSFGELATSPVVLNPVIDNLRLTTTVKDLARSITAVTPRNTVILHVSATDRDPRTAASIANAVTTQLSAELANVGPKSPTGTLLVDARLIQVALPPTVQTSPHTARDTAIALLAGLALACGVVYLLSRLDDKLRTPERIVAASGLPLLGALRRVSSRGHDLVVSAPGDPLTTDFQQLAANLEAALGARPAVLAVTSAVQAEGRTTVAANLAATLAQNGRQVALLDADLRAPRVADFVDTQATPGLLQILTDHSVAAEAVQHQERLGFDVIPAGGTAQNASPLLAAQAMRDLISRLRQSYSVVIIDTPPVLPFADTVALGRHVDGVLVVGHAQKTTRSQLATTLEALHAAGARTVGAVLNQARAADFTTSGGYRGVSTETLAATQAAAQSRAAVTPAVST